MGDCLGHVGAIALTLWVTCWGGGGGGGSEASPRKLRTEGGGQERKPASGRIRRLVHKIVHKHLQGVGSAGACKRLAAAFLAPDRRSKAPSDIRVFGETFFITRTLLLAPVTWDDVTTSQSKVRFSSLAR